MEWDGIQMKVVIPEDSQAAILAQWRGAKAKLWMYHVTHNKLAIMLYKPDEPEVIYVVANGCEHITGPFSWKDADVSIVQSDGTETQQVVDESAGFALTCSSAVVVRGPATDLDRTFEGFLDDSPDTATQGRN